MALAAYAKAQLQRSGIEPLFPDETTFKEFAVDAGRNAADAVRDARGRGVNPGYALGRDFPELQHGLLVAVTERRTTAEIDRLAEVLAATSAGADAGAARGMAPAR